MTERRFYEGEMKGERRSAPAAVRNREPIADVLADWLPATGLVLEIASGTGEHVVHFARRFPNLEWQPSDMHPDALASIRAWLAEQDCSNILDPVELDVSGDDWPARRADALLNINMVHISPWTAAIGLLNGARRLLAAGAPLILYGPWLSDDIETAESNLAFDRQLKGVDPSWGLRRVEDFAAEAAERGFALEEKREMPANNLMLLFRRGGDG
jgi:hypothetical protein